MSKSKTPKSGPGTCRRCGADGLILIRPGTLWAGLCNRCKCKLFPPAGRRGQSPEALTPSLETPSTT